MCARAGAGKLPRFIRQTELSMSGFLPFFTPIQDSWRVNAKAIEGIEAGQRSEKRLEESKRRAWRPETG